MKKAVAEFETSYTTMLAEVTTQPCCLAHLPVCPEVKSLYVLHATTSQNVVFCALFWQWSIATY